MKRDPKDLVRYTASERANHWAVGMSFILLALSGLAFFHPAFYPLSQLFGGGVWARILHPFIGVVMALLVRLDVLPFLEAEHHHADRQGMVEPCRRDGGWR